jgi:hypothetical protein
LVDVFVGVVALTVAAAAGSIDLASEKEEGYQKGGDDLRFHDARERVSKRK